MNEAEIEAKIIGDLQRIGPMFAGIFDDAGEQEAIHRLVTRGAVVRRYEGPAGAMGLSKIAIA